VVSPIAQYAPGDAEQGDGELVTGGSAAKSLGERRHELWAAERQIGLTERLDRRVRVRREGERAFGVDQGKRRVARERQGGRRDMESQVVGLGA
jgi:hypothetical protein